MRYKAKREIIEPADGEHPTFILARKGEICEFLHNAELAYDACFKNSEGESFYANYDEFQVEEPEA